MLVPIWSRFERRRHAAIPYIPSGPITVPSDNYTIQGKDIFPPDAGGDTISIPARANCSIIGNRIWMRGGSGIINTGSCPNLLIRDNLFIYAGADRRGPIPNGLWNGMYLQSGANGAQVLRNKVMGASGIALNGFTGGLVSGFEHQDARQGTFGASISLVTTTGVTVEDFYIKNDLSKAWTGDNVNIFGGAGGNTIRRGVIDGNNHPQGAIVQVEQATGANFIEDVYGLNWCNQAFSSFNSVGTSFTRCGARKNYQPTSQGRGPSAAGSPGAFMSFAGASATVFHLCKYADLKQGAIPYYQEGSVVEADVTYEDFRMPIPYSWSPA